jgi:hypothetical protein
MKRREMVAKQIRTLEEFYDEVDLAVSVLVDASVWFATQEGVDRDRARGLSTVVGELVGWCEQEVPRA